MVRRKIFIAVLLMTSAFAFAGCGSEYQKAYNEMQAEIDKQAAEMQKETEKQAAEMTAKMESQTQTLLDGSEQKEEAAPVEEEKEKTDAGDPAEDSDPEEAHAELDEYPKEVDGINVTFYKDVRDDNTGNWRLAVIYNGDDLNSYVADFYKAYIRDEEEFLGIVNLGLKTTTRVDRVMENWLDIMVMEYQDGEEHSAKTLFGGAELDHYWIDMETGEIDLIEDDE